MSKKKDEFCYIIQPYEYRFKILSTTIFSNVFVNDSKLTLCCFTCDWWRLLCSELWLVAVEASSLVLDESDFVEEDSDPMRGPLPWAEDGGGLAGPRCTAPGGTC